ncbi:MAG: fumarate reductase subunit D [Micromonosporaceae bacterium]|nr:fumarate reductase subunit D [Micromonosporaceae bacterium]
MAAPARRTRAEPLLWLLFSSGGVVAALFIPVLLLLFGVAIPLGWVSTPDHAHLLAVLQHPVTRVVLLGLCVLALFHWAHRFRYTLHEGLRLKRLGTLVEILCYGGAVAGSLISAYLLLWAW